MFQEGVGVNLQQGTTLPSVIVVKVKSSGCSDTEGLMKAHRCERNGLFSSFARTREEGQGHGKY